MVEACDQSECRSCSELEAVTKTISMLDAASLVSYTRPENWVAATLYRPS
jgi:hypothetical protein